MEIFLGALAGLLGVIVGGALQHFTSQRAIDRQHEWDRSRLVHEKLELIAQAANELGKKMSQLYSGGISKVESGEPYRPEVSLPFANLEMLLNFYAPELKPEYCQLVALRDDMGNTLVDLVSGRVPSDRAKKQDLNEKLITASFKAEKISEKLINRASELGRKHLDLKAEQDHPSDARTSRG